MRKRNLREYIRAGTDKDLYDAQHLVDRVLSNSEIELDVATLCFSKDMFVGVTIEISHKFPEGEFDEMLNYLDDPQWDAPLQILLSFQHSEAFDRPHVLTWMRSFYEKYDRTSLEDAKRLLEQTLMHWLSAMDRLEITNRNVRPSDSCIKVFDQNLVAKAMQYTSGLKSDKTDWSDQVLRDTQKFRGFRAIPDIQNAENALRDISQIFENLSEPISRLRTSLVLANCMKPEDFHIRPMLLLGEPGIGKTYLASKLGKALGVPMEKISAGGAQGGFQITGSHSSWTDAKPGVVFTLLAHGKSASPVVMIDEVDKIVDAKYPVLPVLLDLLELETSRQFKDEYYEMKFDASKVIFIMTANSLENVPAPLLSRCEVFNIPRPGIKQRLRIIESLIEKLCTKTNREIRLNLPTAIKLAERIDLDLRKVNFLVEDAFARAIQAGENTASIWLPEHKGLEEVTCKQEEGRVLH